MPDDRGTIAAIVAVAVLAALLWVTLGEALSERSRERFAAVVHGIGAATAAVHRFFVKPQEKKEAPSEPTQ